MVGKFGAGNFLDAISLQDSPSGGERDVWAFFSPMYANDMRSFTGFTAYDIAMSPGYAPDGRDGVTYTDDLGLKKAYYDTTLGLWAWSVHAIGDWAGARVVRQGELSGGDSYNIGVTADGLSIVGYQASPTPQTWTLPGGGVIVDVLPLDWNGNGLQDQIVVLAKDGVSVRQYDTGTVLMQATGADAGSSLDFVHRIRGMNHNHDGFVWIDQQGSVQTLCFIYSLTNFEGPHFLYNGVTGITVADWDGDLDQDVFLSHQLNLHTLCLINHENEALPPPGYAFSTTNPDWAMYLQLETEEGVVINGTPTVPNPGCAAGDFDNDGDLDLFVVATDPLAREHAIYHNEVESVVTTQWRPDFTDMSFTYVGSSGRNFLYLKEDGSGTLPGGATEVAFHISYGANIADHGVVATEFDAPVYRPVGQSIYSIPTRMHTDWAYIRVFTYVVGSDRKALVPACVWFAALDPDIEPEDLEEIFGGTFDTSTMVSLSGTEFPGEPEMGGGAGGGDGDDPPPTFPPPPKPTP